MQYLNFKIGMKAGGYINDKERVIQLIDTYQKLIFSICYKICCDYFAAEDLTQETFIAAYENLHRFDESNEKNYLARIAANKSIDYLRNASNRQIPTSTDFFLTQIDYENQPEKVYLKTEIQRKMEKCLEELKSPYNEVAYAYYINEKTANEIALERNQNIKTIQTQIYRAREMLRKLYGKEAM